MNKEEICNIAQVENLQGITSRIRFMKPINPNTVKIPRNCVMPLEPTVSICVNQVRQFP